MRDKSHGVNDTDDLPRGVADSGDLPRDGKGERAHKVLATGDLEREVEATGELAREVEGTDDLEEERDMRICCSSPPASLDTEVDGDLECKRGLRFSSRAFSIFCIFFPLQVPETEALRGMLDLT